MVAAVCAWHEEHAPAAAEIERRLGLGERLVMAAPALVETYAVLTRLPPPHRLSGADALALIEANFMSAAAIVALNAAAYQKLLRRAAERGIAGGGTYDAVIAACALAAKAAAVLTFNERNFRPFAGQDFQVVVPEKRRR